MTVRQITEFLMITPSDEVEKVSVGINTENFYEEYTIDEFGDIPNELSDREVTYYCLAENFMNLFV